ncbi:hypothetical protein [Thalassoroseus pseudoceratinae]|uniref:hypothetical protein n=1 Tax=Thalassoroseus pseudoceratinae TaxID=2713176 RepID=UPI00141EACA1|nr:hypothetical protein [Thalassoroseus pseudoceratinae]
MLNAYKVPVNAIDFSPEPTPAFINAVKHLRIVAIDLARAEGWELHTEKSNSSEAVYCTIRRSRYWYGIRIAAHRPAYVCSADYQQIVVPLRVAEVTTLAPAERQLRQALRSGGHVVADPVEVNTALIEATERHFQQTGRIRLPNSDACAIRHRLHFRARWTFDEEQANRNGNP